MKKKVILILALFTIIIFSFVGCRKLGSESGASSGMNITSTVSGVVSSVESGGKELVSQVSGVVSAITSTK